MKKLFLTTLIAVLVVGLVFGGCAKPAPTPAPPTPAPPTPAPPTPAPPTPAPPAPSPPPAKATKLIGATWPPPTNPGSIAVEEWAKEFEKRTGGRYTVEVVHGGALAQLPETYDVVRSGMADISYVVCQSVEQPFPVAEFLSLPWLQCPHAAQNTALFELYKKGYFDKDFKDVKTLFVYPGPQEDFLTKGKPVHKLADTKGLKLTSGGGMIKSKVIQALGATPVFGVPPEIYLMLEKGIADGTMVSGMGLKEFGWWEQLDYLIDPLRVCNVTMPVFMNLDTFNRMPDDVKAIIDEMEADGYYGRLAALGYGRDTLDSINFFLSEEGGGTLITAEEWGPEAVAEVDEALAPIWKEWIADKEAMGLPAREVIDYFYNRLVEQGVNKPAVGYTPGG